MVGGVGGVGGGGWRWVAVTRAPHTNATWRTPCGWTYGSRPCSLFFRHTSVRRCLICFSEAGAGAFGGEVAGRHTAFRLPPGDPHRPAVSPGGVGDALPGEEAEAQGNAQPGRQPGNPQKWARTDESDQIKGRGGKGKAKAKGGKPRSPGRLGIPGYNTASIFENVLMNAADAKTVAKKLGYPPVFACAGDFGWVTRPRLWWLSLRWGDLTSDPSDGSALSWAKKGGFHRLQLNMARKAVLAGRPGAHIRAVYTTPRCRSCSFCWSSWATPTWRASRPTLPRAST